MNPQDPIPFAVQMHAESGSATLDWARLGGDADGDGERWRLRIAAGADGFCGSVVVERPVHGAAPHWLIPGVWYGQGRAEDRPTYPGLGPADLGDFRAPGWDFPAERCALPIVLACQAGRWTGLEAGPHWRLLGPDGAEHRARAAAIWGDDEPQIGCGLRWDGASGALRISLPGIDGPRRNTRCRYDGGRRPLVSLPPRWSAEVEIVRWDVDAGAGGFARACAGCRARLATAHSPAEALEPDLVSRVAAQGILDWHLAPGDPPYLVYTSAFDRVQEFNANHRGTTLGWHVEPLGFVGGFLSARALWQAARSGGPASGGSIAETLIDRWCREAPGADGIFRTSYHPGRARTLNGHFPNPVPAGCWNADGSGDTPFYGSCWMPQGRLHARTVADAAWQLARILAGPARDNAHAGSWRQSLRGCLEGALAMQHPDGAMGTVWDACEHRIVEMRGVAGLLWAAAFVESADLFLDDPAFVRRLHDAARRLGERHLDDLSSGLLCGAPEDTSLSPTSDSGTVALSAYHALARLDGRRWHDAWRRSADWTLTWRRGFNQSFPPRSQYGAFGLRTRGAELASSQNHQLHIWGLIEQAALNGLSDLTGDASYAAAVDDLWRFAGQMLITEAGQWNGQVGMCTEQFYATDWSVWDGWDPGPMHRQKGLAMGSSHLWCLSFLALAAEERRQCG
jgi:hypothetical protein